MKIGVVGFAFFVAAMLLLTTIAAADFANTRVFFIIKRTIGFTVTLPGQSAVAAGNTTNAFIGGSAAVYTADIEFNVTNKSYAWVNASVAPCCANQQNLGIPIFNYTNTGTIPINISLSFNGSGGATLTTVPGVNVTASNGTNSGNLAGMLATGAVGCGLGPFPGLDAAPDEAGAANVKCKNLSNVSGLTTPGYAYGVFIADLQPNQYRGLWLWAFFDNFPATGGSVGAAPYTKNLTHSSRSYDGT